jgi:sn-glycerol 3-phosphate transport system permease protein
VTASVGERAGERVGARAREGVGGRRARQVGIYALLVVTFLVILFPLLYALSGSFMTADEIGAYPPHFLPSGLDLANYQTVLSRLPIPRYLLNSLIVSGGVMIGQLITASLAAYAFAVREFRGRTALFACFLFTLMIPFEVTIIPNFQTVQGLGWTDTYIGLIGPFVATAFGTFLLRQFFLTIPNDYLDAARIDGCGEFRIMLQVVARLAKPAIAAVALFSVLLCWNDFFGPLLYTLQDSHHWTLSVGLSQFRNQYSVQWNLVMAGTIVFMAPVILLFFFAQKAFVEGITLTGVKG